VIRAALLLLGAGAAGVVNPPAALSQRPAAADSVIDRIVAVVGNRAITRSQVMERMFQGTLQGGAPPTDPAERARLEKDIVAILVNEELLVQEAGRDTAIKILEEDVTKAVDANMRATRARYTSEAAYQQDLRTAGFETSDEYRLWLTEQQRRTFQIRDLMQRLQASGKLKPIAPTEREIREYFEEHKNSFGKRGESVSFRQIIVAPIPKAPARERARVLADSILQELRKGGDFPTAARRFSMDLQSREGGGDIGWVRRGIGLDQRFEDVAFALRPGVISEPVETPFGFHLIQVTRAQPAEVQVRHILIRPTLDQEDADSAMRTAERVRAAIAQGAPFDSLARLHHDKAEERDLDGIPIDALPQTYKDALNGVIAGQTTAVFPLQEAGDPTRAKYALVLVTERIPAGSVGFDDVKEQIRQLLGQQLTQGRYLDRLRQASLVDLRSPSPPP
jgi:peptidyl-prolyl cis-trans isomerase SurA